MKELVLRAHKAISQNPELKNSIYQTLLAVVVAGLLVGGYRGYRWWSAHRIGQAQEAFSQAYQSFAQAAQQHGPAQSMQFKSAQVAFETARSQHGRTSLAPFYTAFLARIVAQSEHNITRASDMMAEAASGMKSSSPYRTLYQIARCLLLLDGTAEQAAIGWRELEKLVNDDANVLQDMARYYAALYLTSQGKDQQARDLWNKIIASKRTGADRKDSIWVSLARSHVAAA